MDIEILYDDAGFQYDVQLEVGKGRWLNASGCHVALIVHNKIGKKGEFWQDVYDDLKAGTDECLNPDCDWHQCGGKGETEEAPDKQEKG